MTSRNYLAFITLKRPMPPEIPFTQSRHSMSAARTFSILAAIGCTLGSFCQIAENNAALPVYRSLKEALREPARVHSLDLSDQHIRLLPKEISLLINLEELRLRNDDLTELPEEIGDLGKLRILDLSGNPIRHLPVHFKDLNMLDELYRTGTAASTWSRT